MPYKPGEEAPRKDAGKISEETRREVFENEETRRQRGEPEGPKEGRHYSGASEKGGDTSPGRDGG